MSQWRRIVFSNNVFVLSKARYARPGLSLAGGITAHLRVSRHNLQGSVGAFPSAILLVFLKALPSVFAAQSLRLPHQVRPLMPPQV